MDDGFEGPWISAVGLIDWVKPLLMGLCCRQEASPTLLYLQGQKVWRHTLWNPAARGDPRDPLIQAIRSWGCEKRF
jgi:hypothetical protein